MSMTPTGMLPEGFERGPMQGRNIIGETTEALHRFMIDGWKEEGPPPRIEEDLSFVPKDREEVVYVYMYRAARNQTLVNAKRFRAAKVQVDGGIFYERPPIYLDLYYLVAVHSKHRSDAERLLGWALLRLHEATHLVYRPRRYTLPGGSEVDSCGQAWGPENDGDDVIMEKVALALVDDLTVGDAINFYTIHEAPYRPFLTYQARCAMEGSLVASSSPTIISHAKRPERMDVGGPTHELPNGRLGRIKTRPEGPKPPIGPSGQNYRRTTETNDSEE
jgi:hypothetical protein